MSTQFSALVSKLKEIFQINRPDLDFGVYRILNARSAEITEFLDKRLKTKVEQYRSPMLFDYTSHTQSSEVKFVLDLQSYINTPAADDLLKDYELYLLRNADNKYRGLGFALAGNFYPDFLLWLVNKQTGQQYLTLVDPKGIRNMNHDDAKIEFYKEIKNIEAKLDHPELTLNSFILSITPMKDILNNSLSEEEFAEKNVLFMVGNGTAYLQKMLEKILQP